MASSRETKDYISASELGTYSYCHRAYWHKSRGEKQVISRAMRQGSKDYKVLSEQVKYVETGQANSSRGFGIATVLFIATFLLLLSRFL